MFIVYLTLITSLVVSLFHFSLTVSGIGVLWLILNTVYLSQIDRPLRRGFRLGLFNMKYRSNRLLKTPIWGSGKVLWVLPVKCHACRHRKLRSNEQPPPPSFFAIFTIELGLLQAWPLHFCCKHHGNWVLKAVSCLLHRKISAGLCFESEWSK